MHHKGNIQKFLSIFLLVFIPFFIIANFTLLKSKRDLAAHFTSDFIPKDQYLSEKSFVFILYANEANYPACQKNLTSIFHQNYDSYRVIFLATENVQSYLVELKKIAAIENKSHLFTPQVTSEVLPTIATFKEAIETCKDEEIIIQMECNDWLAHENVLTSLNAIYTSSDDIWLTYSQYLEYPSYKKGSSKPKFRSLLRNRTSNRIPWLSAPFKTFYAGLFKQINPDSKFSFHRPLSQSVLDLYMLPLAKMSKNHIRYIEDILYIHKSNPISKLPQKTS